MPSSPSATARRFSTGWELIRQIPWLRVFVEGVVIVGGRAELGSVPDQRGGGRPRAYL